MYAKGMSSDTHDLVFILVAFAPAFTLPTLGIHVLLLDRWSMVDSITAVEDWARRSNYPKRAITFYIVTTGTLSVISTVLSTWSHSMYWAFRSLPILFPILVIYLPYVWAVAMLISSGLYGTYVYHFSSSRAAESCLFMPCTAKSMKSEDQLYALLLGIAMFVAGEVLRPLYKKMKGHREEWEIWRQEFVEIWRGLGSDRRDSEISIKTLLS